jgi:hypothetical protein
MIMKDWACYPARIVHDHWEGGVSGGRRQRPPRMARKAPFGGRMFLGI